MLWNVCIKYLDTNVKEGNNRLFRNVWLFQEKDAWQKDMNNFTELQIVPLKHILIWNFFREILFYLKD